MLFVYVGTVNQTTKSYDIHIYDVSKDLFPVAAQIESDNIPNIVEFLHAYHNKQEEKEKLTAKFKIEIKDFYELATPAPANPSKFISIFDLLDFYGAVSYEAPSEIKHFKPVRNVGSLYWIDQYGDHQNSWDGWDSGWWSMSQPCALLTLFSIKNKTKTDDPVNTNLDNCIKVCKERIYESNSPRRVNYRKTVAN